MIKKVIADNSSEKITATWDGTRFGIVQLRKDNDIGTPFSVILLNPDEAMILLKFLSSCGKEE